MARINATGIDDLLQRVWDSKGTDLLLTVGSAPLCRVDGDMLPLSDTEVLTPVECERLILGILSKDAQAELERNLELDFSFNWKSRARFRGNVFYQRHSLALSLRLIPMSIPTMDELGVPEIIKTLCGFPQGLVLVTGPTGSGKSTTQAAALDWINDTRACHVVTIEDPIEYIHHHKKSAINQREVGEDTLSFGRALRSVLREDPDVLLVGEMRDQESIQTTLTIAETGHLVFATLHTNDTATALDRVVDVFPTDRQEQIRVQLASSLVAVVAQRLVPRIGGGMVAAFELLMVNHAVRNLIREGKSAQLRNVITTSQREGMQTLEMDLNRLVIEGTISYDDAISKSMHPKDIKKPVPVAVPVGGGLPAASGPGAAEVGAGAPATAAAAGPDGNGATPAAPAAAPPSNGRRFRRG